jgi:hypothetical protein
MPSRRAAYESRDKNALSSSGGTIVAASVQATSAAPPRAAVCVRANSPSSMRARASPGGTRPPKNVAGAIDARS